MYREHISNNLLNGFNPLSKLRDTRMDNTMVDYRIEIGLASLFFFFPFYYYTYYAYTNSKTDYTGTDN